ncbi:MAG TPA: putative toxin-antitoxin system toxin component, PIN family [Terricaulis sp.]|nr:putative toxin-antitoxin system toxin component, PIN family [Terricaulis sp.]
MRVVLDTNVLVAALRSKTGAAAELLRAAHDGRVVAIANVALFAEYEAVLTRAEHLAAGGVTRSDVHDALDALAAGIESAEPHFSWRPQLADADDEMVLEAAVNGGADMIVTFEVATFRDAAARFGIDVMTPGAFWAKVFL